MDHRFLNHDSPEISKAWDALKTGVAVGSVVEGIVFAKAHFGAWIDLAVGFPALLEIIYVTAIT